MPGIETILPIVYSEGVVKERFSINRMVELLSANPARLFGLDYCKGAVRVGLDADLVILDPSKSKTITAKEQYTNIDYNPFEGLKLSGAVDMTLSRGEVVYEDGKVLGEKGRGRFVKRKRQC